ncbi:MAG TPA: deiodinase-related protein, partial [Thermoanaerobaculia bacterium]
VVIVVAGGAFVVFRIGPRNIIGMIRYDQREEGSLEVGHRAPEVQLLTLDGKGTKRLGEFIGSKPLVLIFGSFT